MARGGADFSAPAPFSVALRQTGGGEEGSCHSHQLWRELKGGRCRGDCREREREREGAERVNETDVIGLARSVKWWWQRQTLIVSSAQSSRQVICCGALGQERRRWRNRGDVEKGVVPFFGKMEGGGGGGGGGYPWGPADSQHFATPVKQMEGGSTSSHPSQLGFPLQILKPNG